MRESPSKTTLFVTGAPGTTDLLAEELRALGIADAREVHGGVEGTATLEQVYGACLWSRVGLRALWRIAKFPVASEGELYAGVRAIDWSEHLGEADTLAVDFSGNVPGIDHTQFGAQRVKDAIVDQFRDRTGERPSVDRASYADSPEFVGELLRAIDRTKLDDAELVSLSAALSPLFEHPAARKYLGGPTGDELRAMLDEAEALCLAQLAGRDAS